MGSREPEWVAPDADEASGPERPDLIRPYVTVGPGQIRPSAAAPVSPAWVPATPAPSAPAPADPSPAQPSRQATRRGGGHRLRDRDPRLRRYWLTTVDGLALRTPASRIAAATAVVVVVALSAGAVALTVRGTGSTRAAPLGIPGPDEPGPLDPGADGATPTPTPGDQPTGGPPVGPPTTGRPDRSTPPTGANGAGPPPPGPTPTGGRAPAPGPPPGGRDAYGRIEAESFNGESGVNTEANNDGGAPGVHIANLANGDWVRFENVDFSTTAARRLVLRLGGDAGTATRGKVELRVDRRSNAPVASLEIPNTGGWFTFVDRELTIPPMTGVHTIYLTFSSTHRDEFGNINWVTFRR